MDINQVTKELDELFAQQKIEEIPQYLESHIAQAISENAQDVLLTLYNEIIGFYRETGQYALSIENCHKAIALMDEMGIQDTIPYATTLLNAANAHRAAGLLQESLDLYNKVRPIYVAQLKEDDMYFANFYNNLSLLYQEMKDFASAKEQLVNALYIVTHVPDKQFEVAVTQANLANTCIELGQDDEAKARAEEAIRIFEEIGVDDAHYSAALSALGSLYYMDKDYINALSVMEKSRDCVAKYLGTDNIQYQRLSDNIQIIKGRLNETTASNFVDTQTVLEEANDSENPPVQNQETGDTVPENMLENQELEAQALEETVPENEAVENMEPEMTDTNTAERIEPEQTDVESIESEQTGTEPIEAETVQSEITDTEIIDAESTETNIIELEISDAEKAYNEGIEVEKDLFESVIEDIIRESEKTALEEAKQEETEPESIAESTENLTSEMTGLELCRHYYEEYGRPMIAEKFPDYESRIAVGLVGKGSDCFGFDDVLSRDHDFGPRLVMWVTKEVYDQIGKKLQAAYEELPTSFMGIDRIETFHGKDRCGVFIIEEFYKNVLGINPAGIFAQPEGNSASGQEKMDAIKGWLAVQDYALAAAVNGEVFRDEEGIFTKYRELLQAYYPKPVWYRKIAQTCALFSQSGQYNLPRMRRRGQFVSAELAKAECIKHAMKLYYLLNRTYAPHDKWLFKGLPENPLMTVDHTNVAELVEKISLLPADRAHEQELTTAIESLAVIFANELEKQNMVGQCDLYLDACTKELIAKSDALLTAIVASTPVITALSLSIAKAEFEAFDKVQNEGGRASCQNNWPTFKVMRMSQYMTWTEDMLLQYLYEFKTNYEHGRNMVEEKYARMMESTAPAEYAAFADQLPALSDEKKAIMEQVIGLQVKWMEEFALEYPNLAEDARRIHTAEDLPDDTSYETYLRGELGTYSDRMLEMYGRYIVAHAQENSNVAREIMENIVHFYGYQDLEAANAARPV